MNGVELLKKFLITDAPLSVFVPFEVGNSMYRQSG
jgi:hypothetical protein